MENEKEALVIECGCPAFSLEKAMHFKVGIIGGCLVTHEHGDHAKHIKEYIRSFPVYCTLGTAKSCGIDNNALYHQITPLKPFMVGNFKVLPFPTQHDAKEPCGYLVNHPDFGNLLFATDTYYLAYTFKDLSYVMIECNYDRRILERNVEAGVVDRSVMNRVLRSHFSVDNCSKALQANDLSNTKTIFLIHLSDNNSDRRAFPMTIGKVTGKHVVVAEKGMEYDLF